MNPLEQMVIPLLDWYRENARDLPWRRTEDPYQILLSEVMLQQTRVAAVIGYYHRFLETAPTVETLAGLEEDVLLKLWQGLGYYNRARNLQKMAKTVMAEHGGRFPDTYEGLLGLPGVGEYTAGAVSSIAFGRCEAAVDGNVLRVVTRLTADPSDITKTETKRRIAADLKNVMPVEFPGRFNQALMELGATLCGPNRAPQCLACPCAHFCKAHTAGTAAQLPVKSPKKVKTEENRTVFILSCDGSYALQKRPDSGLLAGLWEFPNIPGSLDMAQGLESIKNWGLQPRQPLREIKRQHIFTHIKWHMQGLYIEVSEKHGAFTWFTAREIRNHAALPTAFRQFWEEIDHV